MIDPKEFSDMSDYPQDGYGRINLVHQFMNDDGPYYEDEGPEEIIPDEPEIRDDEHDTDI